MAIKLKIKVPQEDSSGVDHNELLNKGKKTHLELDDLALEVEESRGLFSSLKLKLENIISLIITKHEDLENSGEKTHLELDGMFGEVEESRGTFPSLKLKLDDIENSIITKHEDLENSGEKTHLELDTLWLDVEDAKSKEDGTSFTSLKEKLDSLKPKLNLKDLEDVELEGIKDKQTLVWSESEKVFKPGNAISEGGGGGGGSGGGTPSKLNYKISTEYAEGLLSLERYSGDLNKVVRYTYDEKDQVTLKRVEWSSGEVFERSYTYDEDGNVSGVGDSGTEEIIIGSGAIQDEVNDRLTVVEKKTETLEDKSLKMVRTILQIQFKYDIALNLTKNRCSDYFIDVLQDSSNIESYEGCSYNSTEETIF